MDNNRVQDIESFNKKFFGSKTELINWYHIEGIYNFSSYYIAIVSLDDSRIKEYFEGYSLKIINLQSGNILASKQFLFHDYLPGWGTRYDSEQCPYDAKDIRKLDWYLANYIGYQNAFEMVKIIFSYIDQFKIS